MTDVQDRSQGPDRCRGSIHCRQYHDQPGDVPAGSGTATEGTVNHNCCCCDPCRYIRPRPYVFVHSDSEHCVRCVPRMLLLQFIPYDLESACCRQFVVPMPHVTAPESEFIGTYSGSLFGVDVVVELGNLPAETGTDTVCAWHITMTGTGTSTADLDTTILIDHDTVTSLSVPVVTLENVTGPEGCLGYLTVVDNARRKVPFIRKQAELSWQTGTGTGSGEVEFITLDPPCGDCTQVCSRVCATGYRHGDGEYGHTVFEWFDDSLETGTGTSRGWEYTDSTTGLTERFYLEEDEYGRATIRPELDTEETGGEFYDSIVVDAERLCSCRLKAEFIAFIEDENGLEVPRLLTLRCGECSCWDYLCGGCRCVPETLCVFYWDGTTIHQNLHLVWDATELQWGTESDPLILRIVSSDDGTDCYIVPVIDGVQAVSAYGDFPTFRCTKETATHQFDFENETLSVSHQGPVDLANQTGTGTTRLNIAFIASALRPDCNAGPCTQATPCYQNCGSHPLHLVMTFRQWGEIGDFSEPYAGASCTTIEVDLAYWETVSYVHETGYVKFDCGYIGFFQAGECCVVRVEVLNGVAHLWTPLPFRNGCESGFEAFFTLVESCDPYLADSGVIMYGPQMNFLCLECTDDTARTQVTIVEGA